jgi:hypothetical protein
LWLGFISVFTATSLLAQLSTAALNGVVTDSSGAVVRGASVVLRNLDTGIETLTTSNDTGNYRFGKHSGQVFDESISSFAFGEWRFAILIYGYA